MPENFGPLAFNWVESHVIDLNEQCNEAVAEGLSEYLIPAQELPVTESWDAICEATVIFATHIVVTRASLSKLSNNIAERKSPNERFYEQSL